MGSNAENSLGQGTHTQQIKPQYSLQIKYYRCHCAGTLGYALEARVTNQREMTFENKSKRVICSYRQCSTVSTRACRPNAT